MTQDTDRTERETLPEVSTEEAFEDKYRRSVLLQEQEQG